MKSTIMVFGFAIMSSMFFLKAMGKIRWDEYILRSSVENTENSVLIELLRTSKLRGIQYVDRNDACLELCERRIKLLTEISRRELFLPPDVENYLRLGFVEPGSYEALKLETIARTMLDAKDWRPQVRGLIAAYESIKLQYGLICSLMI